MKKLFLSLFLVCLSSQVAFAHQPVLVFENEVQVSDPEVSKAYYSELQGEPQVYRIVSNESFELYANILVPDLEDQRQDFVVIVREKFGDNPPVVYMDGSKFEWTRFFEVFGRDWYFKGPEFRTNLEPGEYELIVSNDGFQGKYALAVGEKEVFGVKEIFGTLKVLPKLKRDFFEVSPAGLLLSPFGAGYVIFTFVLAWIFGFLYRVILRRMAKSKVRRAHKNIGTMDRLFRFVLAVLFFVVAVLTSWNPVLLFISGFCLFEAVFSWCGLNAALGKSTCPL
ncbi:DUF2892 domain-containing protein [Patescibacteria group bacterium]|nr:DUF2892 domain-containing protein [Patescibacteria group bacterium]